MSEMQRLLSIMAQLRNPEGGCPWDLKQDFASIAPYTIEEAYEVADAVAREDMTDLKDELGDLLLQVVFHAQMATEAEHFSFEDVARSINDKMVRRHPHVFGDATVTTADDQVNAWEAMKKAERGADQDPSALAGITRGMPEWMRAQKLHSRAAAVGFDWPDAAGVLDKVREEVGELAEAMDEPEHADHCEEEIGDLLFSTIALAKHLKVDPGRALRGANRKFEARFRTLEQLASEPLDDLAMYQLDRLWEAAKKALAADSSSNPGEG